MVATLLAAVVAIMLTTVLLSWQVVVLETRHSAGRPRQGEKGASDAPSCLRYPEGPNHPLRMEWLLSTSLELGRTVASHKGELCRDEPVTGRPMWMPSGES